MTKKRRWAGWYWILIIIGVLASPALLRIWPYCFSKLVPSVGPCTQPSEAIAQFDVLTALLAAWGVVFVFFTLYSERVQMREQRDETRAREAELVEERRLATLLRVRGEAFQLLNAWQEIVHNTSYQQFDGRVAFFQASRALKSHLDGMSSNMAREQYYEEYHAETLAVPFNHYFRLLYHIVKYINSSPLREDEKKDLVRIVRAHLSEPEHYLLFWNGASEHGAKMKPLIEKYFLLHNFDWQNSGIKESNFQALYPENHRRWQEEEAGKG